MYDGFRIWSMVMTVEHELRQSHLERMAWIGAAVPAHRPGTPRMQWSAARRAWTWACGRLADIPRRRVVRRGPAA